MWKETGKTYPRNSWEEVTEECEEIENRHDSHELDCDTIKIREYCEAAALFGQMVKMPTPDELPEGAPSLSPAPPRTAKEAFEAALGAAKHRVNLYWPAITDVAEKLMEIGHLTGEEVEEIVYKSEIFQEEPS